MEYETIYSNSIDFKKYGCSLETLIHSWSIFSVCVIPKDWVAWFGTVWYYEYYGGWSSWDHHIARMTAGVRPPPVDAWDQAAMIMGVHPGIMVQLDPTQQCSDVDWCIVSTFVQKSQISTWKKNRVGSCPIFSHLKDFFMSIREPFTSK